MAQVAVIERFDLVRETAKEVVRHQRGNATNKAIEFLDKVTIDALCDGIFRRQNWVRDSGLFGVMYPRNYSMHVKNTERRSNAPYMQQIECLLKASEDSAIEFLFHFLQPEIRYLNKWAPDRNGKPRWTWPSDYYDEVEKKSYNKTVENVRQRKITGKFMLADILNSTKTIPFEFSEPPVTEQVVDSDRLKIRYSHEVPEVTGLVEISASITNLPGHYKISMRITNTSNAKSDTAKGYSDEEVAIKSFYGTYVKLKSEGGIIISPTENETELKRELVKCSNINTSPMLSNAEEGLLFASPIILYDYPRYKPVPMQQSLVDLSQSEQALLDSLTELSEEEKRKLVGSGKIKVLHKVVIALSRIKPKWIKYLYEFQWVGIQLFVKKLLNDNESPLIICAPTDSGKSLIFYVCTALMVLFNEKSSGTVAFITFPTRALNSQQFGEMIDFFYQLREQGLRLTLGLYMGSEFGDKEVAVRTYWPPSVKAGDEIPDIDRCPNCGGEKLVAHKPDERRMIPKCNSCGKELDFIYLSNMETEEFCPNVIVGTPDKIMNSLTTNPWSQAIFGAPCKKCPNCFRHYLLTWSNQGDAVHSCRYCNIDLGPETKTQSTPQFVVFDEVHTLSGTQGNLLGQFLALMKVTNRKYGLKNKYWYLGATATIANQHELVKNLTGHSRQQEFPTKENFHSYFEIKHDVPRHRYLMLEPLARTTRWSVSTVTLDLFSILKQANESDDAAIKELKSLGLDPSQAYKIQTIYVLRKTDGRNLEKYVPDLADRKGLPTPLTQFGSGDLPRSELVGLNRKVREYKLDVLIVTQIYGQGVDFPGLNIIHFFGIPRSFIELAQVVGRTGRRELPGLVLLHTQPEIPRDQWVYKHFREVIGNMQELYEPVPINVMNRFAISLSLPNVLNALIISRTANDYRLRFADYCNRYFGNTDHLRELLEDVTEVYLGNGLADKRQEERLKKMIFSRISKLLIEFRTSKYDTTQTLKLWRMLLSSLRDPSNEVPYSDAIGYPILEQLHFKGPADEPTGTEGVTNA